MRIRTVATVVLSACAVACVTTRPQTFRTFFVPPPRQVQPVEEIAIEAPPAVESGLYAHAAPNLQLSMPSAPRPSDADFRLKRAEDRFLAGKRAYAEGRPADARTEFDRAVEILLTAPDNTADRSRIERRLEEMVQTVYRYDVDGLGAGEPEDKVAYEQSLRDQILELTFPVDPRLKSKVLEEIKATASQLPLEVTDPVLSYINFFSTDRGRRILISGLRRSGRYRDMIQLVLAEQGLPQELIYVAQIESGFLPRAVSNKRAVGMWQFVQFRGREYGLMQTPATDDRLDPERATRAAARHLRDLYEHFGDWYLALSAYNCGPGCVDRAVMRTGYADFWTLRRMNVLPKDTNNYVPVILAITIMAKNAKDYGLEGVEFDRPIEYDSIDLTAPTQVALMADAIDRPVSEIRELNPGLLKTVAPARYTMRLPKGTLDPVQAAFERVPETHRAAWRVHRVGPGDTLATVAKRFGTPATAISAANRGPFPETGELLAIPAPQQLEKPAVRKARAKRARRPVAAAARKPPAAALRPQL